LHNHLEGSMGATSDQEPGGAKQVDRHDAVNVASSRLLGPLDSEGSFGLVWQEGQPQRAPRVRKGAFSAVTPALLFRCVGRCDECH